MIATFVKVQVEEDGGIHIPPVVLQELGAAPRQEVEVMVTLLPVKKPITPVKLTDEDRTVVGLDQIGCMADKADANGTVVDAWRRAISNFVIFSSASLRAMAHHPLSRIGFPGEPGRKPLDCFHWFGVIDRSTFDTAPRPIFFTRSISQTVQVAPKSSHCSPFRPERGPEFAHSTEIHRA